jgi:hypothetical protein
MVHAFNNLNYVTIPVAGLRATDQLRATHQLGAIHKLCVTHIFSINQISVGGLTANEYALDWVPLCLIVDPIHSDNMRLCHG